jgi:uncharacterized membrane protein/predicted DsbA family dithiol-disulfide isomerase
MSLPALAEPCAENVSAGATRAALAVRALALVALSVSVALLVNHFRPNARLCSFESGCEEVLTSRFASVLGVPLPVVGVVTFAALLGVSLFPASRAGRLLLPLTVAAGAGGLALLVIQVVVLRSVCPYCAVVDGSAVAVAVVQVVWGRRAVAAPAVPFRPLWLAAAVVTVAFGAVVGAVGIGGEGGERPVPPQVTALWVPGKVNVVEVADFDCPHCRRMHAVLTQFLAEEGDRVHFVRLTAPMPVHARARDASRAFLCAGRLGKGDEMAEALFEARDLSPEGCERLATSLGLPPPEFQACVADPATDARIDGDLAWVKVACPALPVVWVQDRMVVGVQPIDTLRAAARRAESRQAAESR